MGKKRNREKSEERIRKKIRKLEKKLNTKRRRLSSSDDESYPSAPPDSHVVQSLIEVESDYLASRPATPVDQCLDSQAVPGAISSVVEDLPVLIHAPALPSVANPSNAMPSANAINTESAPGTSITTEVVERDLDIEILKLLGEAPEPEVIFGKPIHKDIAARWQDILRRGLTQELKDKMSKEYLIPSNCELLLPPTLNLEAKAALTEPFVKRDASLLNRQKQISLAVSALAQAIDSLISNEGEPNLKQKVLKPISDASRILCNLHYNETKIRRKFVISSINTGLKDTLINSTTDKFLFGDNMAEKLKAAKTVQRSGEALKTVQKPRFKKNLGNTNFNFRNQSNYKSLQQKTGGRDAGKPHPAPRQQYRAPAQAPPARLGRSPPPPPPAQIRRQNRN